MCLNPQKMVPIAKHERMSVYFSTHCYGRCKKNNNEPLLGMVGDGLWHWVYHFTIITSLCFSHKLVYNPINYGSNPCKP